MSTRVMHSSTPRDGSPQMELRVKEEYNSIADRYDESWDTYVTRTLEETTSRLPVMSGDELLIDVACGTGTFALQLLRRPDCAGLRVCGIDVSSEMLRDFERKAKASFGVDCVRWFCVESSESVGSEPSFDGAAAEGNKIGPGEEQESVFDESPGLEQRAGSATIDCIPFADNTFDCMTTTNAFHYFPDPVKALREMNRVIRPGGWLVLTDWCDDYLLCKLCKWWLRLRNKPFSEFYGSKHLASAVRKAGFVLVSIDTYRATKLWGMMTLVARKARYKSFSFDEGSD